MVSSKSAFARGFRRNAEKAVKICNLVIGVFTGLGSGAFAVYCRFGGWPEGCAGAKMIH